ncbi:hypothetical protein T8K17_01880 [Thalassobaculum sp. OXR-137]|uniref:hypothetical protein n=1 Tax=Thalassobaculum sp. OXR-137 TaxID=3100173 RepID=UPI002AC9425F|nr:hypothetical protein [Thalassobaculum sp. OXR-137]WPZ33207.1 hypothetical protein T8K17_18435 [Thalassobaculum sp. OXR-137]WPZ34900.1 hypothetical protein T8K17_01880 [Thalassobaculum sp. OXR-137]
MTAPALPLPQLLAELAEAHGLGAALSLAREAGGTIVFLPEKPTPLLTRRFGDQVATWLVSTYGTGPVAIPLGPYARDRVRAEKLRQAIINGEGSASDLARRFGIAARTVKRHRAKAREQDDDLPLLAGLSQDQD